LLYLCGVKQLVNYISSQLSDLYGEDEALALAWWILEELTGLNRTQLQFGDKGTKNIPNLQIDDPKIAEIIARLLNFEPVQYIFGHTEWLGLDLKVTPATLIPRPETAELVEEINAQMGGKKKMNVLDVGTGSGCIAVALKKAHPEWHVVGVDISAEAVEVAKENAKRNGVEVDFRQGDIFSDESGQIELFNGGEIEASGSFDIIVSNPPYIRESEKESMRRNVLDYEPATALFVPDSDPLCFYNRIATLFRRQPTTYFLFFEINEAFPSELSSMLHNLGYTDIQVHNDIYGKPRIIQGRMA